MHTAAQVLIALGGIALLLGAVTAALFGTMWIALLAMRYFPLVRRRDD